MTLRPSRRFRRRGARQALCVGLVLPLLSGGPAALADPYPVAVIRALNKVTARASTLQAPIGEPVRFGTIEIVVRTCDKRPPEETPESAAFLEIFDVSGDEARTAVFTGWMLSSTPGLSTLEHPIYDVWVLDCVSNADSSASAPTGSR